MKKLCLFDQNGRIVLRPESAWRTLPGAFTLIELLVVIAIIAILAAILLPVLTQAKVRGLMTADLNNFKQLQTCWHMYVLDNNDFLPMNFVSGGGALSNSWVVGDAQSDVTEQNVQKGVLFQYNSQTKIYQCPANTVLVRVTGLPPLGSGLKPNQLVPQTRTCSIEYSLGGNDARSVAGPWTITRNGYPTYKSYQKFSQIPVTRIASKIVFADESQWTLDDGAFGCYPSGDNSWFNLPANRHGRGSVWSFADGHAEFWTWHGSTVNSNYLQTTYYNGNDTTIPGDSSDDLARTEAGGPSP